MTEYDDILNELKLYENTRMLRERHTAMLKTQSPSQYYTTLEKDYKYIGANADQFVAGLRLLIDRCRILEKKTLDLMNMQLAILIAALNAAEAKSDHINAKIFRETIEDLKKGMVP